MPSDLSQTASDDKPVSKLLEVRNLDVAYPGEAGFSSAVIDLSFSMTAGETLGIVGESGSGKTQTALALMGLLPKTARVSGDTLFSGGDLLKMSPKQLNQVRGTDIAMIFQDPMTSLNPHLTIGRQMSRVLEYHQGCSRREAIIAATEMLDAVRIPEAAKRISQYPHEMSGGMRQRITIATALLCKPRLLIADEPTTALDVTVQAQILELLKNLQQEFATAILLITHDMGVVAGSCDRVLVMRHGHNRESGAVNDIFYRSKDSYTRQLLAAVPRLDESRSSRLTELGESDEAIITDLAAREPGADMLLVDDLVVRFDVDRSGFLQPRRWVNAVNNVSFLVRQGETLGVVGESGCGKSSLARGVLQLIDIYEGSVCLQGDELSHLTSRQLKPHRKQMQIIFQDPLASLDPRMTVGDIIAEPLQTFYPQLSKIERMESVQKMLRRVGLQPDHVYRYPHEFSGGQCQRIGIARALICKPELVVCDEPVSALDVSVQAQIVNLLMDLQAELGLSLIFIAHDLAVVRHISHRVLVMYLGRVVEIADSADLYDSPMHPYTRALISAVPIPDPELERQRDHALLQGDMPSPLNPPSGCAFRTRCPLADRRCATETPELRAIGSRLVACHHA